MYRGIGESRPEVARVPNAKGQVGKKFVWQKVALLNMLTEWAASHQELPIENHRTLWLEPWNLAHFSQTRHWVVHTTVTETAFRIWITFCSQCFAFCWKTNEDFDVFTKGNIPRILEAVNLLMPGNNLAMCWKKVWQGWLWQCLYALRVKLYVNNILRTRYVLEEVTGSDHSTANVQPRVFNAGLSCEA